MKIRTQLVVAFLLLAVVPLTSIVLFSYFTSIRAVQRAVADEANQRTREMDQRLEVVKAKLEHGVDRLRHLNFNTLLRSEGLPPPDSPFVGQLMSEMGDAALYFQSLTVVPRAPVDAGARGSPLLIMPSAPEAPRAPLPPTAESPALMVAEPGEVPRIISDPEVRPFKIDMSHLAVALQEAASQRLETLAAEIETATEGEDEASSEVEDLAAQVGEATAELAVLGLKEALESVRRISEEHEAVEESAAPGRGRKSPDLERRAEVLGRSVEMLQQKIEYSERRRAFASIPTEERFRIEKKRRRAERLLGQKLGLVIQDRGAVVGEVHAEVSMEALLAQVLAETPRNDGEVPFALGADGEAYPADEADRELLDSLDLYRDPETDLAKARQGAGEWMVVSKVDPNSDLTLGVAYPIGDSLAEVRETTVRNLGFGLALVGLALLGILPLSKRITRGLETVTEGARKIARGDLSTRVPVRSKNEIGQLASSFNQMAQDLRTHQDRLLEEEGRRKEQEVETRFLEVEFQRKSRELDDAREFQLSLLPKVLPRHPSFDIAVDMQTATEVGGDYYDFHLADDGTLTLAIGDATGHGARAGTMVTVVKSLFSSSASEVAPSEFLQQAARTVTRMDLGRMAMALTLARFEGERVTLSAAGMPPALLHRAATEEVEEVALAGMPLGGLAFEYAERSLELYAGDTLLLLSDGLPELPNDQGEPLGYTEVRSLFAASAAKAPAEVIADMADAATRWTGSGPPSDDMTFVVVKKK